MVDSPRLVQAGTVGATPIMVDVTTLGSAVAVRVTLTSNYAMLHPAGYPFRRSYTGAATPQYPHTVASGTTLEVLRCEATALIAAGAAVEVG